jgi:hypothetical protein
LGFFLTALPDAYILRLDQNHHRPLGNSLNRLNTI